MPGFFSSLFGSSADARAEAPPAEPPSPPAPAPEAPAASEDVSESARPDARRASRFPIFTDYTVPIFGLPDPEQAYFHGHIDGAFDGDSETFLALIAAHRAEQQSREALDSARAQTEATRTALGSSQDQHAEVAAADSALALYREAESKAEEHYENLSAQHDEAEAQWKDTRHRGSRVSSALYMIAGGVFLAGDFVVSKQVVAQALHLPEEYERVLFAAGIAALAFLVKIAYERLVERPYSDGNGRVFRWVILASAALTLATLSVLGVLRAQVVAEEEMLTRQGETMGFDTLDLGAAADTATQSADMVLNTWQVVGFVLTAILFALAGAICFGVALVTLHDYLTLRRPIQKRLDALKRDARQARDAYQKASTGRADFEKTQADAACRLATIEVPSVLQQRLGALEASLPDLAEAYHDAHQRVLEHSYRSGYLLARQNLAGVPLGTSMEEYYREGGWRGEGARGDGAPSARHGAAGERFSRHGTTGGRRDTGARNGTRRPYLDLRDDILDPTL